MQKAEQRGCTVDELKQSNKSFHWIWCYSSNRQTFMMNNMLNLALECSSQIRKSLDRSNYLAFGFINQFIGWLCIIFDSEMMNEVILVLQCAQLLTVCLICFVYCLIACFACRERPQVQPPLLLMDSVWSSLRAASVNQALTQMPEYVIGQNAS